MKVFVLTVAAILLPATAGATSFAVGLCGTFSNPAPNSELSGTWVCPSASSLGVSSIASELLVYNSDYSNGLTQLVTAVTDWTFSGGTFAFSSDVTSSTGGSNSSPAISGDGLTLNASANLPPLVLAGFYDNITVFGTPTVTWANQSTIGSAVDTTGYAEVVYVTNSPITTTPEPRSVFLLGAGLIFGGSLAGVRRCATSAQTRAASSRSGG